MAKKPNRKLIKLQNATGLTKQQALQQLRKEKK